MPVSLVSSVNQATDQGHFGTTIAAATPAATTTGTAAPAAPTPISVAAPISAAGGSSMAASVTPASASPAAAASAASTAAADDGVPRYYREDTDGDGGDGGAGTAMGRPAVANTEGIPLLTTRAGPPIPVSAAAEDGGVVGVVTGLMSYLLSRPPAADTPAGAAAGTTAAAAATAADAAAASWEARLKEEYRALIVYIKRCAAADAAWVKVAATGKDGVNWAGTCWWYHNNLRYEFVLQLEIPVGYPAVPPVIILPELLGKTPKMYTGGRICLSTHFLPLWRSKAPSFGIAHALALGLAPWLSIEVARMAELGLITPK